LFGNFRSVDWFPFCLYFASTLSAISTDTVYPWKTTAQEHKAKVHEEYVTANRECSDECGRDCL
jgi:hypothetical protein